MSTVVEPTERVIEALKTSVKIVGVDEFLRVTGVSKRCLDSWLKREAWVPLIIIKIACEINKEAPDAEPYLKYVDECISGARLKVKELEDSPLDERSLEDLIKELCERGITLQRPKPLTFPKLLVLSVVLSSFIFIAGYFGYIVGKTIGALYAVVGAMSGVMLGLGVVIILSIWLGRIMHKRK